MQRFVSKRSSSSVDLASSSLDDVRAEGAAIALSVGLSCHEAGKGNRSDAPAGSSAGNVLCRSTSSTIMSSPMVSAWWRAGETIAQPFTDEEIVYTSTPCATPAAALVEDEPRGSTATRDQWKTERRWGMQRCLCDVWWLCPGLFNGINRNTPNRWKRSAPRAAPLGRRTLLSRAGHDTRAHHASDRPVPQRGHDRSLVHQWLDAEGLDVRPGHVWVRDSCVACT